MEALEELFAGTPVTCVVSEHIIEDIWYKFALHAIKALEEKNAGVFE